VIILVLGGARSGKSEVAERMVARLPGPVTYVATIQLGVDTSADADHELVERVRAHRERRPSHWTTNEAGADLAGLLVTSPGTVLLDSLGPWVAAHPHADPAELCRAITGRHGDTVVVSEEVGLGVHPSSEAGRAFRDDLGQLNQAVAAVADDVFLVVAGRTLRLRPGDPDLTAPS
jgi:adenosyl cobinamide kinase/adenosyl cobinamide phosphate guanylyltransferase